MRPVLRFLPISTVCYRSFVSASGLSLKRPADKRRGWQNFILLIAFCVTFSLVEPEKGSAALVVSFEGTLEKASDHIFAPPDTLGLDGATFSFSSFHNNTTWSSGSLVRTDATSFSFTINGSTLGDGSYTQPFGTGFSWIYSTGLMRASTHDDLFFRVSKSGRPDGLLWNPLWSSGSVTPSAGGLISQDNWDLDAAPASISLQHFPTGFGGNSGDSYNLRLTSFTVTAVPEPNTVALLLLGTGVVCFRRRSRLP